MPRAFRLGRIQKRRSNDQSLVDAEQHTEATDGSTLEGGVGNELARRELINRFTHKQLAALLWATDYVPLFLHELEQYADVSVSVSGSCDCSARCSLLTQLAACCARCQ